MDAMVFLGTPARKLLRGGSAAIAQAVADGGAALDGAGAGDFLSSLERSATSGMAIADTAARKLLHGGAIAEGISGDISFDVLGGVGQLVTGFFAALAGAAHQFVLPLEAFWRWLQAAAAAAALPFVLGATAVLVLVALVWFCGPILCAVALGSWGYAKRS
uniref:Uncharacterized protein n=1 Tax=Arundo donax TaxID=35708 RepID=A0A0A9EC71_ARUDO